jgi:CheY-like chemotaxis protein
MSVVFLYEDRQDLCDPAVEQLKAMGVETITAWDGINFETVALPKIIELYAKQGQLSLMIIDVWVQHGDGFDIVRRLKTALPQVENVPLVIWTDAAAPEQLSGWHLVQRHTPIDVLHKPTEPQQAVSELVGFIMRTIGPRRP